MPVLQAGTTITLDKPFYTTGDSVRIRVSGVVSDFGDEPPAYPGEFVERNAYFVVLRSNRFTEYRNVYREGGNQILAIVPMTTLTQQTMVDWEPITVDLGGMPDRNFTFWYGVTPSPPFFSIVDNLTSLRYIDPRGWPSVTIPWAPPGVEPELPLEPTGADVDDDSSGTVFGVKLFSPLAIIGALLLAGALILQSRKKK